MKRYSTGFTIFEMVIVLIMVGILTAGMVPLLRTQHTRTMEDANRQALATAKDVVVSWALANGGLPLPLTSVAPTTKNEYVPLYPPGWVANNESYLPWDEHMVANSLPPLGVPTFGSYRKYFWYDLRKELRRDYGAAGNPQSPPYVNLDAAPTPQNFCANVKLALNDTPVAPGAAPYVCRLPTTGEETTACPGTVSAASPAAFVITSFGNDRTPDQAHALLNVVAPGPFVRNYENPARSVNFERFAGGDIHYDDKVVSVSLTELAGQCDKLVGPTCAQSAERMLRLAKTSAVGVDIYYRIAGGACQLWPAATPQIFRGCMAGATTAGVFSDNLCTTGILPATDLNTLDTNSDRIADVLVTGTGPGDASHY